MTAPLRPMNLGEILDRTLQIYRSRFLVFFTIAAIPAIAMRCVRVADLVWFRSQSVSHPKDQFSTYMWNFAIELGFFHISSFFGHLAQPAHIKLASSSILGEPCSIASALRSPLDRWRTYLWITFLKISGDLLVPEIVTIGLFAVLGYSFQELGLLDTKLNWPFVLMIFAPPILGIYLFLRIGGGLSLTMPASALETLSGFKSIRRSWKLTRASRVRIMSTWLAIFATAWIMTYVFQLLIVQVIYLLAAALHLTSFAHQVYIPVAYATVTVTHALFGPIYPIAITLFYYDQRIRREAYDIEWMMHRAGLVVPAPPQPEVQPLPDPQQRSQRDTPPSLPPQPGVLQ